ncbi:YcgL domain-containing protein [Catenovulum sp. SX2]|uniref:YcgL domain-containing protein n=1 Tax=Catenovulum TaxID=1172191 RepID=UPI00036E1DAB|nr:YcgL domain-containing protein [Catenovulum agarivorans]
MLCYIYRSSKKEDTYLYLAKKEDFAQVPEPLMQSFGLAHFVIILDLSKKKRLALADINKVKDDLANKGYYLQLPPAKENLLDELKEYVKKDLNNEKTSD